MANLQRLVEWGNWGLLFYEKEPGAYAPAVMHGRINFPVGARGPMDGHVGSPERERYKAMSAAWMQDAVLPEGLVPVG